MHSKASVKLSDRGIFVCVFLVSCVLFAFQAGLPQAESALAARRGVRSRCHWLFTFLWIGFISSFSQLNRSNGEKRSEFVGHMDITIVV